MNVESHCMNVSKVYDWINQNINIKSKEHVSISDDNAGDFCINFNIPCDGTRTLIWDGTNVGDFTGNFTVSIAEQCMNSIDLFVNGNYVTSLTGGQAYSVQFTELQSVEVQCQATASAGYCSGTLYIQTAVQDSDSPSYEVNCFLSDMEGNQLDASSENAICCVEQSDPENRTHIETMVSGKKIILQEVDIVLKGFITIQFIDEMGDVGGECTLPFWEAETVYLCAPVGTSIECKLSDFKCKVNFVEFCGCCVELSIRISICLSVFATSPATVHLKGKYCEPRSGNFQISCPEQSIPF